MTWIRVQENIYRDSDDPNRYYIRLYLDGVRKNKIIHGGFKDAKKCLATLRTEIQTTAERGSSTTLGKLLESYIDHCNATSKVRPATLVTYRYYLVTLKPILGVQISKLTSRTLDKFYAKLSASGQSPSSIKKYNALISGALEQAIKWRWIKNNVAKEATMPKDRGLEFTVPTVDDVKLLLENLPAPLAEFAALAASTGARRGELCALQWADIDFKSRFMTINKSLGKDGNVGTTKTGKGRKILIDDFTVAVLQKIKTDQTEAAEKIDMTVTAESYILSREPGGAKPLAVDGVTQGFHRTALRLGLPHIHPHSLRHFAATIMITQGVDPRTAADRLGHANPAMTLQVYSHHSIEAEQKAIEVIGRVLG